MRHDATSASLYKRLLGNVQVETNTPFCYVPASSVKKRFVISLVRSKKMTKCCVLSCSVITPVFTPPDRTCCSTHTSFSAVMSNPSGCYRIHKRLLWYFHRFFEDLRDSRISKNRCMKSFGLEIKCAWSLFIKMEKNRLCNNVFWAQQNLGAQKFWWALPPNAGLASFF